MADFKVGDTVLVDKRDWRGRSGDPVEAEVVKVGRTNMTVKAGWRESIFLLSTGRENTPHARKYKQDAGQVYTPADWAAYLERVRALDRVRRHQRGHGGVLDWGGLNDAASIDIVRLADLLDEIQAKTEKETRS